MQPMSEHRVGDERSMLEYQLDAQRVELFDLLEGLSEAEARAQLVPSPTTPLGLLTHVIFVEMVWFHHRVADTPRAELGIPETIDESFVLAPNDTVASVRQRYLDVCARSREIAAQHELDEVFDWHGSPISLRFIYAHLLTELARHAGHGDILVEQLQAQRQASEN
jgi:hypothetical protein